jgi:hypothetical protein
MKNIILFLGALICLSGCKKVLELSPLDKLTPAEAFSSERGLILYTNSFYNALPDAKAIFSADQLSDYASVNSVSTYIQKNGFTPVLAGGWAWSDLRNINYFLENNKNPDVPVAIRNNYTGIARLFRAFFYYNMVKKFGPVPWYNKSLTVDDPDLYKGRDTRSLVMDSVLADLNFAVANIKDTKDATSSTITRVVAQAFKSRVCLFEGTFRKYHKEEVNNTGTIINSDLSATSVTWLNEALTAATFVMESGKYKLYNTGNPDKDYRALFTTESPVNDEVLLAIVYNNSLLKYHDANYWFTSPTYGPRMSLRKSFVNTYLNADGTRFTDQSNFNSIQFITETANRDRRLEQTIRLGLYKRSDGTIAPPDFNYTYTGYQIKKYTLDDKTLDATPKNYNSIPVIRYAEVLLNYAEAKAELGLFTNADWIKTIQLIRSRAGIVNSAFPGTADTYLQTNYFPDISNAALLEIRRERGIELVDEGFRYDDLIRWKAGQLFTTVVDGLYVPQKNTVYDLNGDTKPDVAFVDAVPSTKVAGVVYVVVNGTSTKLSNGTTGNLITLANVETAFPERNYYYPIPQAQIVLNPNLKNHPSW